MIITPDFVFISNPRTGSTFARKAIKAAYAALPPAGGGNGTLLRELILPIRRGSGRSGRDHHGTFSQIPQEHAHLPVISVVRNPYTHLVSIFELGLWHLEQEGEVTTDPTSFRRFLRVQESAAQRRWALSPKRQGLGPLSLHFVQMFASDPRAAFGEIRAGRSPAEIARHIPAITLLRQERLRADLCGALSPFLSPRQLAAIEAMAASHITRRSRTWAPTDLDSAIASRIRRRETFLFELLAQRGLAYSLENADFSQPAPCPH
jgi:hypothetical protein